MPAPKVDFKHIRQNATFEAVLAHYGLHSQKDGHKDGQFKALCPFHDDTKPSLKVNMLKNIYHCFACDAGGNILEFVQQMEGGDLRPAAIKLAEICGIETSPSAGSRKPAKYKKSSTKKDKMVKFQPEATKKKAKRKFTPESESDEFEETNGVPYNRPLTFTLKNFEAEHAFFEKRGIGPEVREHFGLGISTRGMMKDRMVIPIHNAKGELVAYCGRWPSSDVPDGEPKYKLPTGFHKEIELFNLHRLTKNEDVLILVESYLSVFFLWECGYASVSPMGRSLAHQQVELLKENGTQHIVVLFDGDDPGRAGAEKVANELINVDFWVRLPEVPDGFKPHKANADELFDLLGF